MGLISEEYVGSEFSILDGLKQFDIDLKMNNIWTLDELDMGLV